MARGQNSRSRRIAKVASLVAILCSGVKAQVDPGTPANKDRPIIWSDEFNGGGIDTTNRWEYDLWAPGTVNNELQRYVNTRDTSYIENGQLVLRAFLSGNEYLSARMRTKAFYKYGEVQVRATVPIATGFWPAIWQLPQVVNWPQCGEMDIMEHVTCDLNTVVSTVHTGAYNHVLGTQKNGVTRFNVHDFHVYKNAWTADYVSYSADNQAPHFTFNNDHANNDATWPFNKPFNVILNIAVGGDWGGYCLNGQRPNFPNDGVNNVMRVDYVRIYGENYCPGPYNGFPECEGRIQWLQANQQPGMADNSRCAAQHLLNAQGYCPPICSGPFVNNPECAGAIDWMLANWQSNAQFYLNNGLKDGTRCSIQKYLHDKEGGKCPDIFLTFNPGNGSPVASPVQAPVAPPTPSGCDNGGSVWNANADGYTCGARIQWCIDTLGMSLQDAKNRVGSEYPGICGACSTGPSPCAEGMSVWNAVADGYSCGARITWLQQTYGMSRRDAANQVAQEFPGICGACANSFLVFNPEEELPSDDGTTDESNEPSSLSNTYIYAGAGAAGLVALISLAVVMTQKTATQKKMENAVEAKLAAASGSDEVAAHETKISNPMFANDV